MAWLSTRKGIWSRHRLSAPLIALCALGGLSMAREASAALVVVNVNADGTFGTNVPGTDLYEITVHEGDSVRWDNLSPRDSIVQIAGAPAVGANLCEDPALARPYNVNMPYMAGEFTGPLKNSPAGIITLSPNDCGTYSIPLAQSCAPDALVTIAGTRRLCQRPDTVCEPSLGGDVDLKYKTMDETWANPDIDGVFLRLDWKDLQPGPTTYNWTFLERELHQAAKHGKVAVIGVRVGSNSIPDWLFDEAQTGVGLAAVPVNLRDAEGGSQSFPGATCGSSYTLASPSDVNFRNWFTGLFEEMASHLAADSRLFHHVAGIKVSGLGLETIENRAPKRCNAKHPGNNQLVDPVDPFVNGVDHTGGFNFLYETFPGSGTFQTVNAGASCTCNPQVWADAGYTPSELYRFYRYVGATIHNSFVTKAKIFMSIHEGFPQVGENGEYEGDTLGEYDFVNRLITQSSVEGVDYPLPTEQTEEILRDGREGRWADPENGSIPSLYWGRSFMASHQALGILPQDRGLGACSQQAAIDVAPGVNHGSPVFPIASSAIVDGGGGCPNKWAAAEGITHGQNTGFQTTNDIRTPDEVDSSLWNLTANTNATYYENYETVFWRLANEVTPGTGPARAALDPTPTLAGAVAKNLDAWGKVLRHRRYRLSTLNVNNTPLIDPYPTSWQRTFTKDIAANAIEYYYYINPRICGGATPARHMRIKYVGL